MQRRHLLQSLGGLGLGTLPFATATNASAQSTTLKISHQFPGGTLKEGDFRDRLVRQFALDVEKRTKGALKFEIYPGSSLMKTNAQFSSMRKGALDMSLFPLPYAGGGPSTSADSATNFANLTGFPDLIIPAGMTKEGLPVTISFFGPAFSEPKLLGYGYDFEQATVARAQPKNTPPLFTDTITY